MPAIDRMDSRDLYPLMVIILLCHSLSTNFRNIL